MKRLVNSMVLAAAAVAALVGCAKETVSEQASSSGKFVDVKFTAEIPAYQTTKSTVDVNGLTFNTRWADGDKMGIRYQHLAEDSEADGYNLSASYSNGVFSTKLPEYKGIWYYNAYYPYQAADDENAHYVNIPFGAERIQNGNDINSAYDIMCAKYMEFDDAEQGKTDGGKDISFDMVRQTALLYFHLTSQDIDEPLTKATLSVEGDPIAAEAYSMYYSGNNIDTNTYGTAWTTGDSQSITLTFTNAPSSKDFKLWFNILPTVEGLRENGLKNMKLVVETESKTLTLTAPVEELYFPGYISKVEFIDVSSTNWKDKETPAPPVTTPVYEKVTSALTDWSGDYLIVYEGGSVAFDGSLTKFDGTNNYKSVTISENKIEATDEIDGISFAFDVMSGGYSIQSASGYYIGNDSDSNGISYSKENKYLNTINNGVVKCKGNIALQVFVQGGTKPQTNFKYYKSSQKAIALYKRSESLPKAPFITLTPESGSVAADATSASFEVKSNVDWTVSTDAGWVTLGTTSGSNDGTVALSFTTNDGTKERVAVIAVSSADGKVSNTYTLTQKFPGSTSTPLMVTYDFTKITGFNDWGSSYAKHVVKYDVADVVFSSANKNTGTITDRPVTKGQPVCVVMSVGKTIKSVKLICKQWGTKSQTITLNTSTDGGTNYTATTTKSSNFTLSASDIADGVNAVKFTFSSTSNQVGISSLELTYTE